MGQLRVSGRLWEEEEKMVKSDFMFLALGREHQLQLKQSDADARQGNVQVPVHVSRETSRLLGWRGGRRRSRACFYHGRDWVGCGFLCFLR